MPQCHACECGYITDRSNNLKKHLERCRLHSVLQNAQQAWQDEHNAAMNSKDQIIAEKDRQLAERDARIAKLDELVAMMTQSMSEQQREMYKDVKEVRKRKDRYAERTATRINLTEPQRRAIAVRQGWECALCRCDLTLAAFQIDHIIALWRGGQDTDCNRQALCIPCHYTKTQREQVERVQAARTGAGSSVAGDE